MGIYTRSEILIFTKDPCPTKKMIHLTLFLGKGTDEGYEPIKILKQFSALARKRDTTETPGIMSTPRVTMTVTQAQFCQWYDQHKEEREKQQADFLYPYDAPKYCKNTEGTGRIVARDKQS